MPVSSTTNRVVYQGDGTSAVFSFGYPLHAQTDLAVFVFDSSATTAGLILNKILNTDYTFSGTANATGIYPNGGSIIFNSTPNAQSQVILFRSSQVTMAFQVGQNGAIPSSSLNNAVDRLTLLQQRAQDLETRSIHLHDGYPLSFDPTLPSNLAQSAGKRLIVNSSATGWTFDETLGSYIPNTLVYAATNSSLTSLGGAAVNIPLLAQGSSVPQYAALPLGSGQLPSASLTGILSTTQGGTGTGTSYRQFALLYASSATQFADIGKVGDANLPLLGVAGAAPTFGSLPLANASSTSGVLPLYKGGTGTNFGSANTRFGILIFSSAADIGYIPPAEQGWLLTGNASSSPTFQAFSVNNINSGILSVTVGGTGTGTSYIKNGVIFASSETQFASTPAAAGKDQILLCSTVGGGPPVFGAMNLASNSSVTGVLPTLHGGTGVTGTFTQYGMFYALSATQFATTPSTFADYLMTSNGSSQPTFKQLSLGSSASLIGALQIANGGTGQTTAGSALNALLPAQAANAGKILSTDGTNASWATSGGAALAYTSMVAAGTVSTSEDCISLSGGTFTVQLQAETPVGKLYRFYRDSSSLAEVYTIQTSSALGQIGPVPLSGTASRSFTLNTWGESVALLCKGSSKYEVHEHKCSTDWMQYGSTVITATTSNAPAKGANSFQTDLVRFKREGRDVIVNMAISWTATSGATTGNGDYLFNMPDYLNIDMSGGAKDLIVQWNTGVVGAGIANPFNAVGFAHIKANTTNTGGAVFVYNSTQVRIGLGGTSGAAGGAGTGIVSSGFAPMNVANCGYLLEFRVPVKGWQP